MLNNQPMGFYSPATLVKDAQRHGLTVRPIDVTKSDWLCTLEEIANCKLQISNFAVRLGMRYVKGMRESVAHMIVEERKRAPFASIDDLARRVPELQKRELILLAELGALNFLNPADRIHRRDALWQVQRAWRRTGPLLGTIPKPGRGSPPARMTAEERHVAHLYGTGMTVGPHPIAYL